MRKNATKDAVHQTFLVALDDVTIRNPTQLGSDRFEMKRNQETAGDEARATRSRQLRPTRTQATDHCLEKNQR